MERGLPRTKNLSVSSGLRRAAAKHLTTARPATFRHLRDFLHRATYMYVHTYTTPSPLFFFTTRRVYCVFVTVTHWDPVCVSGVRFFHDQYRIFVTFCDWTVSECPL